MPITEGCFAVLTVDAIETTDDFAVIGSLDCFWLGSLGITFVVSAADIRYQVYGANLSDYSDSVPVTSETNVPAGSTGGSAIGMAFRYCAIKAKSATPGVPATVSLQVTAKPHVVIAS
jgi:hypothetical protein